MTEFERHALYERALEIWRERERTYPVRVQRMQPDDFDRMSGAWDRVVKMAAQELGIID